MIEFKGQLSEKNQKEMNKFQHKIGISSGCITALILGVVITVLTVKCDTVFAIAYIMCVLIAVLSSLPIPKKNWYIVCPETVRIDDDGITSIGVKFSQYRLLSQIKRIDDCGDYYRFWFDFPHQSPLFLCQKDLIVQGTIEEFEELFADKIVRKIKG